MSLIDRSSEITNYLHQIEWDDPISITLTHKKWCYEFGKIDRLKVDRNTTYFFNRLNKKIYKNGFNRYNKKLKSLVSVGGDGDVVRFHLHLCVDKPNHIPYLFFKSLVEDSFYKTQYGWRNKDIQPMYSKGWITYMMEQRTKTFNSNDTIDRFSSSIDWVNSNVGLLN